MHVRNLKDEGVSKEKNSAKSLCQARAWAKVPSSPWIWHVIHMRYKQGTARLSTYKQKKSKSTVKTVDGKTKYPCSKNSEQRQSDPKQD